MHGVDVSRAYIRELELTGHEVGGIGLIEVQLQYGVLDLVPYIVGLEDHGIIVVIVAIDLIELSGAAVPATANGEIQAVLPISYALYLQCILGPQVHRYLGIVPSVGENGHSIHGPIIVDYQQAISVPGAVLDVGSRLGALGRLAEGEVAQDQHGQCST